MKNILYFIDLTKDYSRKIIRRNKFIKHYEKNNLFNFRTDDIVL